MKSYLPFLTIAFFLASCSSVYKSGQTPDDVYFSPARPDRPQDEYARVENRDRRMYGDDDVTLEDRYLRMKTRNRRYAFLENDYDCLCYGSNYNSYDNYYRLNNYYGYNNNSWMWNGGYGKYYNPYYANVYYSPYYYNPYYGNPYYSGVVYGNVSPVYNKPRRGNLQTYSSGNTYGGSTQRNNRKIGFDTYQSNDNNYRGSNKNAGSFLRNVFGSGNNSNSSTTTTSPQPSSNNSSSSSSSSSSHAPVRKF